MFVLVLVIFDSGAESFPEGVVLAVLVVGAFILFVIYVIFVIFVGVFFVIYVIPSVSVHTSFVIFFFSFRLFFFFFFFSFFVFFFVGVPRGGGPPAVRHSSVGRLGSTGADMMKEWRGAGSRFRGSRQKYDT